MFKTIEDRVAPGPSIKALIDPIFRVLISLIFIIGGLGHFGQHQMMLDRMEESPWAGTVNSIGDPSILLWLSGGVFFVAGLTLSLGWMTRTSALLLFVTLGRVDKRDSQSRCFLIQDCFLGSRHGSRGFIG